MQNDVRDLWQNQPIAPQTIAVDQIRSAALDYTRKIQIRNAIEYVAIAAVTVFFAYTSWKNPNTLLRIGMGLAIAGGLYVAYQLKTRGSATSPPAEMGLNPWIEFRRSELIRQRDLLLGSWRWYLAPLVPGLAVIALAGALAARGHMGFIVGWCLATAAMFVLIRRVHVRSAAKLQKEIERLNALVEESR